MLQIIFDKFLGVLTLPVFSRRDDRHYLAWLVHGRLLTPEHQHLIISRNGFFSFLEQS